MATLQFLVSFGNIVSYVNIYLEFKHLNSMFIIYMINEKRNNKKRCKWHKSTYLEYYLHCFMVSYKLHNLFVKINVVCSAFCISKFLISLKKAKDVNKFLENQLI